MTRTVLVFGDSNTHGTPPMAHFGPHPRISADRRWPGVFATTLGDGWHVVEEGHPGRTTVHPDKYDGAHKNGAAILPALLESHCPLDAVVIMLGTNDLKSIFCAGPLDVALSLEALVRIIRQTECGIEGTAPKILLISPPAVQEIGTFAEMFRGAEEKCRRLATEIEAAAERVDAAFFDAARVIETDPLDGVHFSEAAHGSLGRAVAAKFVEVMKS